jgi:cardiolipin synthase
VEVQDTEIQTERVLTVPNVLSALRLVGVPVFLWLIFTERDGWAIALLAVSGFTDYLDGVIARRFHQISRVGQLLDPAADRLYILAALIGLSYREVIPWWLLVVLVARDVYIACFLPALRRRGLDALPVHFLGKAATFNLLYAFPLLLLGEGTGWVHDLAHVLGWAFAVWGTALYWWAGLLYTVQFRQVVATVPVRPRPVRT